MVEPSKTTPEHLPQKKARRRGIARVRRKTLLAQRPQAGRQAAAAGLAHIGTECRCDTVIAGYFPTDEEFDVTPLLESLRAKGHRVGLPVVVAPGKPLIFRQWRVDEAMEPGVMGIDVPPPGVPELRPDIVLVPFLEVDRNGFRLGYGGGYYDRTLAALRSQGDVLAIGAGFYGQLVDHVPHDTLDARLDAILTEKGLVSMADATAGKPS